MSAYLPVKRTSLSSVKNLSISLSSQLALVLVFIGLLWTLVVAVPARFGGNATTLSLVPLANERPSVVLKSAHAERKYQFISVVGIVCNISRHSIGDAEAVVELLDKHGKLLGMDSALIGVSELTSGSEAPFKVTMRDADGSASFRVRFRTLMGTTLPSRSQM